MRSILFFARRGVAFWSFASFAQNTENLPNSRYFGGMNLAKIRSFWCQKMTISSHGVAIPLPERPPTFFPSLHRRIARFSLPNSQENEAFSRKSGRPGAKFGHLSARKRENTTNHLIAERTQKSFLFSKFYHYSAPRQRQNLEKCSLFWPFRAFRAAKERFSQLLSNPPPAIEELQPQELKLTTFLTQFGLFVELAKPEKATPPEHQRMIVFVRRGR